MEETALDVPKQSNPYIKIYILGGVAGALIGLAGASFLVKNAQKSGDDVEISMSEGVRLGVLVLGLLRSIATLHEG